MRLKLPPSAATVARLTAVLALLQLFAVAAHSSPKFVVKPPPSWSRAENVDTKPHAVPGSATGSSTLVLDDYQVRVTSTSVERFYHYAFRIENQSGLDDLSHLKFYFEPSYQQLAIHYIQLHRAGAVINELNPAEVKTIQEEEELNERIYNGTFASVVFLNDLRVGDVVDYAFTVSGENPVFENHFAERFGLAEDRPAQKLSVRLLWSSQRPLNVRNRNTEVKPEVKTIGNETEYVWQTYDVPGVETEDSTPAWAERTPIVEASDFKEWGEVVQWALPLYKIQPITDRNLKDKIEKWKAELQTPEQRTLAALRFVQDEVRYLGIEMGRYSHQPTAPEKVFARRFGDCKDKAQLLTTILNSLGVEAAPALVHSRAGKALDNWQPTPFAFNHVIVQAKLAGKTYWFDGTINFQRGGLAAYYDPPYARALVLREGSQSLETIPDPARDSGSVTVNQVYKISDYGQPVTFVVTSSYRGSNADIMRSQLASQSLEEFGKGNLNYYARQSPSIKSLGKNEVNDDQNANVITVTENYLIDTLWTEPNHYFYPDQISSALYKPSVAKRSTPLAIDYPNSINQTIEIELPGTALTPDDSDSISDDALLLSYRQSSVGRKIRLEYSLKSLADHVSAEAVGRHIEVLEQMRNSLGIDLARGESSVVRSGVSTRRPASTGALLMVLGVLGTAAVVALVYRRRSRRASQNTWKDLMKVREGTTVASAITVRTPEEITTRLKNLKCACGDDLYQNDAAPAHERFTYDGQTLTGVRLKCAACKRSVDFYFRHETDAAAQPAG